MRPTLILAATLALLATPTAAFDNGLLRVLEPDISGFIGATICIFVLLWLASRLVSFAGKDAPHNEVVTARRAVRVGFFLLWIVIALSLLWHALTVAFSLRIPRSDVDATGVYQQMDRLTR